MAVDVVGEGRGAPEVTPVRGFRPIESCPICLYAGSLVPAALVAAAPKGARIVDTAPLNLDEIIAEMAAADAAGLHRARIPSRHIPLFCPPPQQIPPPPALPNAPDLAPGLPPLPAPPA